MKGLLRCGAVLLIGLTARAEDIQRIWLTHQTNDPSKIVVNWQTAAPGNSSVAITDGKAFNDNVRHEESVTLHHVEVSLPKRDTEYRYCVSSADSKSAFHTFKAYSTDELRVAVVADTGYAKDSWGEAVLREKPHLLLSAGDHVPALHHGQPVEPTDTTAFGQLVDRNHELFSSTPWMPLLGNHDRELRPRGPKPPPEPVYNVEATAFRQFFALPGEGWKWHFDVPEFGVRFIALDFSHLSDQDTTWQTCHSPKRDGPQFGWYRDLMAESHQPFLITLDNERNVTVRGLEGGEWGRMMAQGSLTISGFGYFAERAEVDGVTYYNTSVSGTGTPYPDPKSAVLKSEDNFILLTFRREPRELRIDLKNLHGDVLDSKTFAPRAGSSTP